MLPEDLVWAFDTRNDGASVSLGASAFTYSGAPHSVAVSTDPPGIAYELTYSQGGEAVAAPTDAGTYDVSVRVTEEGYEGEASGQLTIAPAPLTVTVLDASKTYDGSPHDAFEVEYAGFVAGQDASVLGGSLTFGGPAVTAVDVGDHEITASGLTSSNYAVAYVAGTLSIGRSGNVLTVTAAPVNKVYDGQPYAGPFEVSYSGFIEGDDESMLEGELAFGGAAVGAVDVGGYDIVPSGLAAANYQIEYVAAKLEIEPAELVVTVEDAHKVYDGEPYGDFAYSFSGFVGEDDEGVVEGTPSFGEAATAYKPGSYAIELTGLSVKNYDLVIGGATLTIDTLKPAQHSQTSNDPNFDSDTRLEVDFGFDISDTDKYEVVAILETHFNHGDQTRTDVGYRELDVGSDGVVSILPAEFDDWERFVRVEVRVLEHGTLVAEAIWWIKTQ